MTLGKRIAALRGKNKLSQGDLAEKLNVSRQSVSKWETDASIPELDKLIQLSDLFRISLDELVREEAAAACESEESDLPHTQESARQQVIIEKAPTPTRKIVGYILLGFGLLCCVLGLIGGTMMLLIGGYAIFCSLICIFVKKHAGLVIGWVTLLLLFLLTPAFTGIRIFSVFHPGYYRNGIGAIQIVTFVIWALLILLVVFTVRACRRNNG